MTEKIALRVQHKRMTKEDWLKSDAILLEGEIGVESDTGYIKAGNGTDYFPDLPYLSGPPGIIVKGQFDYLEDLKNTYPTGNFGEGYQIKNEDKTVYAWGERHATKSASGNAITLEDSATANLKGLRLYGKSWQDGEPSIEDPKEIHSVDNVDVSLCGKNIAEVRINEPTSYLIATIDISFCDKDKTLSFNCKNIKPSPDHLWFVSQDENYKHISQGGFKRDGDFYSVTIAPTKKTVRRIRIYNKYGSSKDCYAEISNIQVEVGTGHSDYEPYITSGELTVPHKLNAVPVDSDGNYTDGAGQQWVADYVDFDRGVLVKNLEHLYYTAEEIQTWIPWKATRPNSPVTLVSPKVECDRYKFLYTRSFYNKCNNILGSTYSYEPNTYTISRKNINITSIYEDEKQAYEYFNKDFEFLLPLTKTETIPLSDSELEAYAKLHTLYPYTTILNDQGAHTEVDYQSMEVEGEWLDVGKFHTDTNDVTQLQSDMLMKANKRDLVDDVPRINELEGKIKELSSKIDRIVANET